MTVRSAAANTDPYGKSVNTTRQYEIDLLRAFPILFMVIIHVYESLSAGFYDPTPLTPTEHILQFLAGPATAPAFMFALGTGVIYTRHNKPKDLFIRGLKLFLGGYLLNALRSGIPLAIGMAINGKGDFDLVIYCFMNADILHFAGLAFMMTALFIKLGFSPLAIGAAAVVMQVCGQYLASFGETTSFMGYFVGQVYKCFYACCFPLLQWYIFPAAGIVYAFYLKRVSDLDSWYRQILIFAASLLTGFVGYLGISGFDLTQLYTLQNDTFYNQSFVRSVFALMLIFLELGIGHFIISKMSKPQLDFIVNASSSLTSIFVIQWILIGMTFAVFWTFGIPDIPVRWVIPVGILYLLATTVILSIYRTIRKRYSKRIK